MIQYRASFLSFNFSLVMMHRQHVRMYVLASSDHVFSNRCHFSGAVLQSSPEQLTNPRRPFATAMSIASPTAIESTPSANEAKSSASTEDAVGDLLLSLLALPLMAQSSSPGSALELGVVGCCSLEVDDATSPALTRFHPPPEATSVVLAQRSADPTGCAARGGGTRCAARCGGVEGGDTSGCRGGGAEAAGCMPTCSNPTGRGARAPALDVVAPPALDVGAPPALDVVAPAALELTPDIVLSAAAERLFELGAG